MNEIDRYNANPELRLVDLVGLTFPDDGLTNRPVTIRAIRRPHEEVIEFEFPEGAGRSDLLRCLRMEA